MYTHVKHTHTHIYIYRKLFAATQHFVSIHCPRAEQFVCFTLICSESREGLLGRAVALGRVAYLDPFRKQRFRGASDQRFRTMFTPKVSKELRRAFFFLEIDIYHENPWNPLKWKLEDIFFVCQGRGSLEMIPPSRIPGFHIHVLAEDSYSLSLSVRRSPWSIRCQSSRYLPDRHPISLGHPNPMILLRKSA